MSENITTNRNLRDDEIDLSDLFRRMGRAITSFGSSLGRAFLISFVFVLKRWLILGLSIALGIGVSYFLKTTSDSFFTSDLVLRTNSISTADMISYINRLQKYCEEQDKHTLTNAISLSPEQANQIIDISAYWIIDQGNDGMPDFVDYSNSNNVYDTINVRVQDTLDIRVRIKTPEELNNVRNGIISFINSDSLFQRRNRLRLRQNQDLLLRLTYDIVQLDSLQKVKYFEETRNRKPASGGQMVFLQEQNTQLVYYDIYKLYEKKQKLEADRDLYKDIVTVLSEFSVPAKRDNGLIYYGKFVIPICFFITLLFLIILANRKKLEEVYTKYQK